MIKLEIEEYCQECLDFTPDVEKEKLTEDDFFGDSVIYVETSIRCKNRNRCRAIMRYLKKSVDNPVCIKYPSESPTGSPTDDKKGGDEG